MGQQGARGGAEAGPAPTVTALQAALPAQALGERTAHGHLGSRGQTTHRHRLGPRPTRGSEPLMMGVNVAHPPRGGGSGSEGLNQVPESHSCPGAHPQAGPRPSHVSPAASLPGRLPWEPEKQPHPPAAGRAGPAAAPEGSRQQAQRLSPPASAREGTHPTESDVRLRKADLLGNLFLPISPSSTSQGTQRTRTGGSERSPRAPTAREKARG